LVLSASDGSCRSALSSCCATQDFNDLGHNVAPS
jgi:hypothetical protein